MSKPHSLCDQRLLDAFLDEQLSEQDEVDLTQHLDECASCRDSLERQAAPSASWSEAKSLLGSEFRHDSEDARKPSIQIQRVLEILAPTDDPSMLGRLGPYEVSGVVGSGGMGVVLKAFDKSLDRTVAIKVMAPHLASSGSARRRFAREAKAAAAVLHPNVIAIHGVSDDETLPYFVMPYLRGVSLQKRIDTDGPLPLCDVLRIGRQIAAGLAAAHEQGLVHRDIKPANILLEDGVERIVLTDFGLARAVDDASMTRTGVIAGTPQYMSPEQARGDAIDHRSDLYSLGSVLYALCTGRPPFRAETTYGILRRITDDQPRPIREIQPDIPEWLCQIIRRLHAKIPAGRFESAAEVAAILEQCLAHVSQPQSNALPVLSSEHRVGHARKVSLAALSAVGLCAAILASVFVLASQSNLGSHDSPAPIVYAEPPPADRDFELRYDFPTNQAIIYLLAMSVALPDSEVQLDGLVAVESKPTNNGDFRLWFSPNLQLTETSRERTKTEPGATFTGTHIRSNGWRSSRSESVTINDRGEIVSDDELTALPYQAGTFPGLLFRRLPADPNSPTILRGSTTITFSETYAESLDSPDDVDYAESEFAIGEGVPDSVRTARKIIIVQDGVEHEASLQLEFLRLTADQRDGWLASRGGGDPSHRGPKAAISPDEATQILADLNAERRVLYWLHRLRSRSADDLSPQVVDALVQLVDHANPTYRTLVSRILDEIPEDQLNPFHVID